MVFKFVVGVSLDGGGLVILRMERENASGNKNEYQQKVNLLHGVYSYGVTVEGPILIGFAAIIIKKTEVEKLLTFKLLFFR